MVTFTADTLQCDMTKTKGSQQVVWQSLDKGLSNDTEVHLN